MGNIFKMADEDEERQRFSPDSSTQVLSKEKRKHRKKKKHKHKSKKRKRKHSEDQTSDHDDQQSDSTNNSSDLSELSGDEGRLEGKEKNDKEFLIDIKPLNEYIDDRKELNNELFKILERKEMKKLMPKSVKKLDVKELRSRCLDQLEIISKKRLLRIIDGQEMNSSSSESEHEAGNIPSSMEVVEDSSVVQNSQPEPKTEDESVNIMEELSVGPDQDEIDELIEGKTEKPELYDNMESQETPDQGTGKPDEDPADTESQLLELEFRARALKSLMQVRKRVDT